MHAELQSAINFLCSLLYDKLPRRKVSLFGEQLAAYLAVKFRSQWFPMEPQKGSAFRCVRVSPTGLTDAMVSVAAESIGLTLEDILEHIPFDLNIWIDPGEVTYRMGDQGPAQVLYHSGPFPAPLAQPNPWAEMPLPQMAQIPDMSLAQIPQMGSPDPECKFTVGSFAMTRFGTTKLKTAALEAIRQLPQGTFLTENRSSASTPHSLSPMSETNIGIGSGSEGSSSGSPSTFNPLCYDTRWSDGGNTPAETPSLYDALQISRIWS